VGKVLLSIVLVAAAFAGGAAINGPGLRWVQGKVGLISSSDEEAVGTAPQDPNPNPLSLPVSIVESPPASAPARMEAPDVATAATANANASTNAPVPEPKAPAPPDLAALNLDEPPKPGPASEVVPTSVPRLEPPVAKDDAQAARNPAPAPAPASPMALSPPWSDMPGSAPAAAVPPRPYPRANPETESASSSGPESRPAPAGDWAELRRTMRALGVARYGIEGEPGGKVRFHCLIPLAGRRAVGQQFEAEGTDEIQAAQAALKRVALWRATEGEPPAAPAD
jgi:hypothetical protein